jgi:transposase
LFSEAIIMSESALIGIDLGKHSFHLHGQDKSGREVFRKKLSRADDAVLRQSAELVPW